MKKPSQIQINNELLLNLNAIGLMNAMLLSELLETKGVDMKNHPHFQGTIETTNEVYGNLCDLVEG